MEDQIVTIANLNEDITSTPITQMFQLLGRHEAIINKQTKLLHPIWNRGTS